MKTWIMRHLAHYTIHTATTNLKSWLRTDSDRVTDVVLGCVIYVVFLGCLFVAKSVGVFTAFILSPLAAYAIISSAKSLQEKVEKL